MYLEKTIDRSCYRREKTFEKTTVKNKRKMITIFYNEVIFVLGIILMLLIIKIYSYQYFDRVRMWYEKELEKGIQFEKIENYFYECYEKVLFFISKNNSEKINFEKEEIEELLKNDTTMVAEMDINQIELIKQKYKLIKPVEGIVTSKFGIRESDNPIVGQNHKGLDIGASKGTTIVASHEGEVIYADVLESYGKCVVIENENLKTVYAHCSDILVKKGEIVERGKPIAEVGMTGSATGNHLHFEVRYNEEFLDPEELIVWQ